MTEEETAPTLYLALNDSICVRRPSLKKLLISRSQLGDFSLASFIHVFGRERPLGHVVDAGLGRPAARGHRVGVPADQLRSVRGLDHAFRQAPNQASAFSPSALTEAAISSSATAVGWRRCSAGSTETAWLEAF